MQKIIQFGVLGYNMPKSGILPCLHYTTMLQAQAVSNSLFHCAVR